MSTEPNQPNKLSVSIMLLTLAVLAIVIPFSFKTKEEARVRPPLVLKTDAELQLLLGDRNRNQTVDWKELLLETMSTTTKELIAAQGVDEAAVARLADKNNISASFSKNLYVASAYITKNQDLSDDEKIALVADAVKSEAPKVTARIYAVDEINISSGDSISIKKSYGNGMATLLKKANDLKLGSNELAMLHIYTEQKDKTMLNQLFAKKGNVDTILKELLSIEVPLSASGSHLRLVNSVSLFSATLDGFARTDSDPLRSLAFLNGYPEMLQNLLASMDDSQKYFVRGNVPFAATEPGYIFIKK